MSIRDNDWFSCPVCGASVPGDALACPDCGADEETGWSEDAEYDEVDLPELGASDTTPSKKKAFWQSVAYIYIGLLLVFIIWVKSCAI